MQFLFVGSNQILPFAKEHESKF